MHDDSPASIRQSDVLDPSHARAFQAALGRTPSITTGDDLPPFFHQLYFWEARPPAELGRDGHPRTGLGLIPDMGLQRRMWAGGQLKFHAPLIAGQPAEKQSTITSVTRKAGRTGPLAFVTLRHDIRQDDQLCVTEYQDLVYREDPSPDQPQSTPPIAATDEETSRHQSFDSTLLFRYSALTFNGHRIHYDLDYATQVEGYAGLIVHGPLLAQFLMLMATDQLGPLESFVFRATAPLIHTETATLCRRDTALWVRGPDGRQCMQATATPA
ncbi:MaoC family dehydratase N-terminal domain-containing protein [Alisedimentitalea sp. MJ-SS2]|uniref:FAS1-like dehydratase domain-containing protein n=1 Tax=Aliisedimentitalea sp. MJ-SS2 TaxID=3049795 RepID=UPI002909F4C7|nr:MaoC family dehydratase N-terminal domain-containing protein [Alisedimentitalea sp. MJ-SS2]MDU8927727.1 MaoC family dehydratase N-terminal domain-containing protein [Alisedimentitalea sp. MJ-SS2]